MKVNAGAPPRLLILVRIKRLRRLNHAIPPPNHARPLGHTVYAYFADWAQGETPGRPLSWFQSRIEEFNGDIPEPQTCI